jgi:hypothetical protein
MHNQRSIAALKMADHMLAVWDGKSSGTKAEIALAQKMGVQTTVIRLEPVSRFDTSDMTSVLNVLTGQGERVANA